MAGRQYHHYIPQFVLRFFACEQPPSPTTPPNSKPASRSQRKKRRHQQEVFVNYYEIESQKTEAKDTKRIYGHYNNYTVDVAEEDRDPNHVEKALGTLENKASRICKNILQAQQAGKPTFSICRADKDNILRKFLYVMLYRGKFFGDMHNKSIEDYNESDKERVVAFMREKGFRNPKQLWAHHLRVIMETTVDPSGTWKDTVRKEMMFDNAEHYISHFADFFLTIVQPDSDTDEFIITENCFGIFEGRVEFDTPYGQQHFIYHVLAPISTRLALVLRRTILLDDPMNHAMRVLMESGRCSLPGMPPLLPSMLADLPVTIANAPWKTEFITSTRPRLRATDEFIHSIAKISTRHVHKINSIMLAEAKCAITYVSEASMAASLKAWRDDDDFKPSLQDPHIVRRLVLRDQKLVLLTCLRKGSPEPAEFPPPAPYPPDFVGTATVNPEETKSNDQAVDTRPTRTHRERQSGIEGHRLADSLSKHWGRDFQSRHTEGEIPQRLSWLPNRGPTPPSSYVKASDLLAEPELNPNSNCKGAKFNDRSTEDPDSSSVEEPTIRGWEAIFEFCEDFNDALYRRGLRMDEMYDQATRERVLRGIKNEFKNRPPRTREERRKVGQVRTELESQKWKGIFFCGIITGVIFRCLLVGLFWMAASILELVGRCLFLLAEWLLGEWFVSLFDSQVVKFVGYCIVGMAYFMEP
jgi:hypothetical protein